MKRSSKSKPTIVLTGLVVLSLLTVLAVARSAANEPGGADKTGLRQVLVGLIDSIFERDRPEESKPASIKTNPPVHP